METSTRTASVAVVERRGSDAPTVLSLCEKGVDTHSQDLLDLIQQALDDARLSMAQLSAIAVGAGPGSFTGLRIGMSMAKGLAFAAGKPLWVTSSLAALALQVADELDPSAIIVPVLDARRREIFVGFFRASSAGVESLAEELVIAPDSLKKFASQQLADHRGPVHLVGNGVGFYQEALQGIGSTQVGDVRSPRAAEVGRLSLLSSCADALIHAAPVYIRPSDAEIKFPDGNPGGTFASRQK